MVCAYHFFLSSSFSVEKVKYISPVLSKGRKSLTSRSACSGPVPRPTDIPTKKDQGWRGKKVVIVPGWGKDGRGWVVGGGMRGCYSVWEGDVPFQLTPSTASPLFSGHGRKGSWSQQQGLYEQRARKSFTDCAHKDHKHRFPTHRT